MTKRKDRLPEFSTSSKTENAPPRAGTLARATSRVSAEARQWLHSPCKGRDECELARLYRIRGRHADADARVSRFGNCSRAVSRFVYSNRLRGSTAKHCSPCVLQRSSFRLRRNAGTSRSSCSNSLVRLRVTDSSGSAFPHGSWRLPRARHRCFRGKLTRRFGLEFRAPLALQAPARRAPPGPRADSGWAPGLAQNAVARQLPPMERVRACGFGLP